MYVYMYVCMYTCTGPLKTSSSGNACLWTSPKEVCGKFQYLCTYAYMYVCMYVCMHACGYVEKTSAVNLNPYVRMYICMYVCMYVCACGYP